MIGSQTPRLQIEPERIRTDGEDAAMLMQAYGSRLDPWQEIVLSSWLGTDDAGTYTATSAGLSVPRQNGKNVIIEAREFFGLVINGEKILHTAHQVRTAKKSFRRLAAMFEDRRHPEIKRLVKQIRRTNGEEAIELINGGMIEFSARSRQAARGFDGISLIVFDEAQELTDDQLEAMLATLAASATGTRQIIYAGTPPYPGCPGTVFRRIRTGAMKNAGPHDAWHEWSIEAQSVEDINAADNSTWYTTNPALGIHLTEEFTRTEFETMTPDGFARERLGWWSPVLAKQVELAIDPQVWAACGSLQKKPEGKAAFGVKFSSDGSQVTLCAATIPKEGPARISFIEQKPMGQGTKWLADWLNAREKRAACVVIDGRNGADVLIDKISERWRAKGSVIRARSADVTAAAGMLSDALIEKRVTWYKLQESMNESALTATKRPIRGGWGFGGDYSGPIEAAALAYWGASTSKRDPERKMRIG